jgi:transcription initiation factor IIE alpha subunit
MILTAEQFEGEKNYRVAIWIAKTMLSKGLINDKEYKKIDKMFIAKYRPILGTLGH